MSEDTTHPNQASVDSGRLWRRGLSGRSGKVGWAPWIPTIILAIALAAFIAYSLFKPEPKPSPPPPFQAFGAQGQGQLSVANRAPDMVGPALLPPQPLQIKGSLCNNTGEPLPTHVTTKFRRFANGEPEYERQYRPLSPATFPVGCTAIDLSLGVPPDLPPGRYVLYGDVFVDETGGRYSYETEPFLVLPLAGGH